MVSQSSKYLFIKVCLEISQNLELGAEVMFSFLKNFWMSAWHKIDDKVFCRKNKKDTHQIVMKHLENIKVDTKKFYNPAIDRHMTVEEIQEELNKRYSIQGRGISCMIPGKYSREYTDYFISQLADFFGFDFFENRKEECLSRLKPNQRLKLIREYLEKDVEETGSKYWLSPQSAIDSAKMYSKHCEDGEKSIHRLQDMMFFDSLIMNTKRNIDSFGFIVDKEKKDEVGDDLQYEFICFYDEYSSMFDHLNGIDSFDQYQRAIMNVESWTDNEFHREYADDLGPRFGRVDHIKKLKELNEFTGSFKFKDNDEFKLDEYHLFKHEYIKENIEYPISVYQYHLHRCSRVWPDRIDFEIGLQEILNDKDRLQSQLERSKNYDSEKKKKEIPEEQKHLYKEYLAGRFYQQMWRNVKIRPKKLE